MNKKDFNKLSQKEWMEILEAEQFMICERNLPEPPNTSELNHEKKRKIIIAQDAIQNYLALKLNIIADLLASFYESYPDVFETKTDHLLGYPRTEYHCKNVEDIMDISLMTDQSQLEKILQ